MKKFLHRLHTLRFTETACQENMEYEQLAEFVATMQVLVNYSHVIRVPRNVTDTYCGSKDILSSYQTLRKLSRFSHKSPAGIKEEDVLSRGGCFAQLTTVQVKKKVRNYLRSCG